MRVPDDFPIRRTFYRPHSRFDTIVDRGLGVQERKAFDYFDIEEIDLGDDRVQIVPRVWVPNVKHILGNAPLSHVSLCATDSYGVEKLDKKILGLSADGKNVLRCCPKSPKPRYDTLTTYGSRSSARNPKRKAEEMADDSAKKNPKRLTSLANRRGGKGGATGSRKEDKQPVKREKGN
uniref:Uncharacterized protein n=1 Tax=Chenopodium quinoa TaxID=63459 RepID=A0A803N291_CHEQI